MTTTTKIAFRFYFWLLWQFSRGVCAFVLLARAALAVLVYDFGDAVFHLICAAAILHPQNDFKP